MTINEIQEKLNKLSAQAKWYLGGKWPIYELEKIEPRALAELVVAGFAQELLPGFFNPKWKLTDTGLAARILMKNQ